MKKIMNVGFCPVRVGVPDFLSKYTEKCQAASFITIKFVLLHDNNLFSY